MKKISSILFVLLLMLASFAAGTQYPRGDVDQNGQVNIADVTCLIDYLLTGSWEEEPVTPDTHEYVDLGLPSGTLWATCNVGANSPEERGDYFAWGETEPMGDYSADYKWWYWYMDEDSYIVHITKYNTISDWGPVDNKTELDPEDDAAYVNWGSLWRMPSSEQIDELCGNCSWQTTQRNGVNGCLITGANGNALFIPFAGYLIDNIDDGIWGYYWSRTLDSSWPENACSLAFHVFESYEIGESSLGWWLGYDTRSISHPVRAVRVPQN